MKVVRIDDEDTKLTKKQRQQVAILKLTDNGKYIENVGIKDNDFYLLVEYEDDDEYLAFRNHHQLKGGVKSTQEELVRLVRMMIMEDNINKVKAKLEGKDWQKW